MSRLAVLDTSFGPLGQIKRKSWLITLTSALGLFAIIAIALISHNVAPIINHPGVISIRAAPAAPIINKQLLKIEKQPVSIQLHGQSVHVSSQTIRSWLNVYPQTGTINSNSSAIINYLDQLASQYAIAPTARISMSQAGKPDLILAPGSPGFSFGSVQAAAAQIQKNLLTGGGSNVNLPGAVVPFRSLKVANLHKLIDVDLVTKRMYAYQDGKLTRTFLISAGKPSTPTPIGEFKIWEKLPVQEMKAYHPSGALEYDVPNVQWVNYFTHTGNAIHGNYWGARSVFGNINTSHGCVGLMNGDAKWIYDWAPIGTTVTIHN